MARADLADLLRKYETLGALRRDKIRTGLTAPRATFRALAREFPGALRELDTLTLDEIDRRAGALSAVLAGDGKAPDWMAWMHAYHAAMRAALYLKPRLSKGEGVAEDRARVTELAMEASRRAGVAVDAAFVRAVARPPGGRLNNVVFAQLAVWFAAPAEAIAQSLFPRQKPARFPA